MKVGPGRAALAFMILFVLYQSAEGVGQRLLGSLAVQAALMTLCVLAAWPVGRFLLRRRGYDAYALEWRRSVPLWLAAGLLLAMAAKVAAVGLGAALGAYWVGLPPEPEALSALAPVIGFALVSTFIPSIAEDIITRGFWWRLFGDRLRGTAFVLVTAAIYVLNHIYRLENGPAEWLMLLCFGIAYGTALARTGTLWAAVGVHWGWNLSNAFLGSFVDIEATSGLAPVLSAAMHLAMAAIMVAVLPPVRPSNADTGGA